MWYRKARLTRDLAEGRRMADYLVYLQASDGDRLRLGWLDAIELEAWANHLSPNVALQVETLYK